MMKDIDRDRIRAEIEELEEDQRVSGHCGRHVLRIMNLQNQLDWDDYLKNGLSVEDKKVFESIVSGEGEGKNESKLTKEALEKAFEHIERQDCMLKNSPYLAP